MSATRPASDFAFFDNGGLPIAMAHRGGALVDGNRGIENSLLAVETAVGLGFGYVETDVHATADGVVVAFHDDTLDRVTGGAGRVADLPYDVVRRALIGGREPVPMLAEILSSWPELKVNIDCKSAAAIEPLATVIEDQRAADRVCVASFSARRLHRLRARLGPRVATSHSPAGVAALRLFPGRPVRRAFAGRHAQAAQVPVRAGRLRLVTPGFVFRAHELGCQVHVWTVDEPAEMHALLDLGVDGLISDRPDLLRTVCRVRGCWPESG